MAVNNTSRIAERRIRRPASMSDQALNWLPSAIADVHDRGLYRQLANRSSAQAARIEVDGIKYLNFASNDYLGLARDPRIVDAVQQSLQTVGWGGGASPLIVGHSDQHHELEQALATFEQTEATLLFPTGFATNAGVIPALVTSDDVIFSDAHNHASIIDGCRLSRARVEIYRHADADHLAELLKSQTSARRRLIVTDGLFSMDGDVAPLAAIAELADRHDTMLMVDEAHATGVLGEHGRGASELCGVEARVDIKVGTLSKALGCMGGFVAGSRLLIDWIINRSRSYIFSTACPAANCAAGLAALRIVQTEPHRRDELTAAAHDLRTKIQELGWRTGKSTTNIVPIVVGEADKTMDVAGFLRNRGLLVPGIRPPSVPPGNSLLRVSLCWNHTVEMREQLIAALADSA